MFFADSVASPSLLDSLLASACLVQAGVALFLAGAGPGYLQRRLMSEPRDPRTLVKGLPDGITELFARALAKDPEARFATGIDLADALERLVAGG